MREEKAKIVIGGLLHDIGKVIYRSGIMKEHSDSGVEFLKKNRISDSKILNQVKYHHAKALKNAKLEKQDPAYITYIADNISSGTDRRKNKEEKQGFDKYTPLESIFNNINFNEEKRYYPFHNFNNQQIIYPYREKRKLEADDYTLIVHQIEENIKQLEWTKEYLNSLLEVLEETLSYVPASTDRSELGDISLFDHMKLTAAYGACIYDYLIEEEIEDWREELFLEGRGFLEKESFILYSFDLSGIQSFIYNIATKGALKGLRSRSFYLEMLVEHITDELLERLELSRTNLIYSGGGHAYLLLSNTSRTKSVLETFEKEINNWFLKVFDIQIFYAQGWCSCSGSQLINEPSGAYRKVFQKVTSMISENKLNRYEAATLIELNKRDREDGERECSVCHRIDLLTDENKCQICSNFEKISKGIMEDNFFGIYQETESVNLPLPLDVKMVSLTEEALKRDLIQGNQKYIRAYSKNTGFTGKSLATKLWVGDYYSDNEFQKLAGKATGIKRIGVLRADVDNLGHSFVRGFEQKDGSDNYTTLSRTASFSKKMSIYFKNNINLLLERGEYFLDPRDKGRPRNAAVIYAGGDDLFIVGSWDDIIGFSIDLYNSFKEYSGGTLTFSGGIGIYPPSFPVSVIARETGDLEEKAKDFDGASKDSLCLFHEDHCFHWGYFIEEVLENKFKSIQEFFDQSEERGKGFLYKILDLFIQREDKINLARFAYTITRLAPSENAPEINKIQFREFSKKMYQWMKTEEDSKDVITALNIYAYLRRERDDIS